MARPAKWAKDSKGNRIPNPKNPAEFELVGGGYEKPAKRVPRKGKKAPKVPKVAKGKVEQAPLDAAKLLQQVLKASANKKAVDLVALSAKDYQALGVIIAFPKLAAMAHGLKAADWKDAAILRDNKKLLKLISK